MDCKEEMMSVDTDGINMGYANTIGVDEADAPVSAGSSVYNMGHPKRGYAVIFKHEKYDDPKIKARKFASHDATMCKTAFEALGFDVDQCNDLRKDEYEEKLKEIRTMQELKDYNCLVVIFMSHGCEQHKQEYIMLRDEKVLTSTLWKDFTADKFKQMAGKPKLFFIQACRGEMLDKGVMMKPKGWKSDNIPTAEEDYYSLPLKSDMIMMWSVCPGMKAFRAYHDLNGETFKGSVLLHFLCKVLLRDYKKENEDLSSMLLTVTRCVAVQYETRGSYNPDLNKLKQLPYTVSTLMRKVYLGGQVAKVDEQF